MSIGKGEAWDRNRVLDAMHEVEEHRGSRRSFFKSAAIATGTATAALAIGREASAQKTTTTSPNMSLPYQTATNFVQFHILNIINDEDSHLQTIKSLLGSYARPTPTFVNITASTLQQYVTMGSLFCQTGAGAYLGSAPYIMDPNVLAQASAIAPVELAQSAFLNSLLNQTFLPGGSPYAVSLTLPEVLNRVAPYVSSLNGGPEPVFTTTPSFQNDVAILNVALLLEELENAFYNLNYPTFYPSTTP